jgi:hypothetical protein
MFKYVKKKKRKRFPHHSDKMLNYIVGYLFHTYKLSARELGVQHEVTRLVKRALNHYDLVEQRK